MTYTYSGCGLACVTTVCMIDDDPAIGVREAILTRQTDNGHRMIVYDKQTHSTP